VVLKKLAQNFKLQMLGGERAISGTWCQEKANSKL